MIDTHVHLWDVDRLDYPWLNGLPALNRSYVLDDFDEDTRGYEVKGFVFIECTGAMDDRISQDELEWITELANRDERIRGIVAHASLEKGEAVHGLLTWLAERPLVKGVRRLLQGEPDSTCGQVSEGSLCSRSYRQAGDSGWAAGSLAGAHQGIGLASERSLQIIRRPHRSRS